MKTAAVLESSISMMTFKNWVLMLMLFGATCAMLNACGSENENTTKLSCSRKAEQLRSAARNELVAGANDELTRQFFRRHQIEFSFDRFARRYQGIVRKVGSSRRLDCAVVVHVYVDGDGKYLKSEFIESFAGL